MNYLKCKQGLGPDGPAFLSSNTTALFPVGKQEFFKRVWFVDPWLKKETFLRGKETSFAFA